MISPCVTYKDNYQTWPSTLYDVDDDSSYNASDRAAAFALGLKLAEEGRVPAGLIYRGPTVLKEAVAEPAPHALAGTEIDRFRGEYQNVMDSFRG